MLTSRAKTREELVTVLCFIFAPIKRVEKFNTFHGLTSKSDDKWRQLISNAKKAPMSITRYRTEFIAPTLSVQTRKTWQSQSQSQIFGLLGYSGSRFPLPLGRLKRLLRIRFTLGLKPASGSEEDPDIPIFFGEGEDAISSDSRTWRENGPFFFKIIFLVFLMSLYRQIFDIMIIDVTLCTQLFSSQKWLSVTKQKHISVDVMHHKYNFHIMLAETCGHRVDRSEWISISFFHITFGPTLTQPGRISDRKNDSSILPMCEHYVDLSGRTADRFRCLILSYCNYKSTAKKHH